MAKVVGADFTKWITIVLTVFALLGGSFAWASSRFEEQQKDLKADIKESYTRREDFARIEERIVSQERQLNNIDKKLDSILSRVERQR